jgi:anion transporter
MTTIDYLSILLLKSLGRLEIARLVPSLLHVSIAAGETLFRQGDKGDALYIIVEGRVSIRKQLGEEECEVAALSAGEYFGEMSLLSGAPRSATAVAAETLTLLKLSRQRFDSLLKKHPSLGSHLANTLASRFSDQEWNPERPLPEKRLPLPSSATHSVFSDLLSVKKKSVAILCGAIAAASALAWWLPTYGFSQLQAALNGLLLGATILWAFDIFSYHAVAVALPVFIVIFGLARPERALSGFSSPSWFLVLGIFAITAAVGKTGLMYRLVLMLTRWFPRSYHGQTFALALSGLILTPVIPSSNGRAVLAGPIVRDLCETLQFRKGSPGAVGMAMAGLLGFGHMSSLFMNGTATCLLALGLLPPETIAKITWGSWFLDALPLGMAYFLGCYAAIVLIYRPNQKRIFQHTVVQSQLYTLGSFTRDEKICLLTVIFALAAFLTQSVHGINSAWIAMSSFLILFGSNVLDERSVRSDIDWNFLISFGALVSFGAIISESGLTALAAERITPYVSFIAGNPYMFLPAMAVAVTVARFALPLPAALLICILSVVPVAGAVGISPFIVAQVALIAGNPWFSPYQNSVYLNFMESSDNKLFSHRQARILSFWQVAAIVVAIVVAIPYWQMRGLIR